MKNKYMLRIISGRFKGKGIESPSDIAIRPTSGRVKESLFNIIRTQLEGADFLDLFAGTGQIGLEAISNGARCVFADLHPQLVQTNSALLGCRKETEIIQGSFQAVLKQLLLKGPKFDFIFADPPYQNGYYEEIIALSVEVLKENGTLILEHASNFPIETQRMRVVDHRVYGSRSLTFLKGEKYEVDGLSRQF